MRLVIAGGPVKVSASSSRLKLARENSIAAYRPSSGLFIAFDRPLFAYTHPPCPARRAFCPYLVARASFANERREPSLG